MSLKKLCSFHLNRRDRTVKEGRTSDQLLDVRHKLGTFLEGISWEGSASEQALRSLKSSSPSSMMKRCWLRAKQSSSWKIQQLAKGERARRGGLRAPPVSLSLGLRCLANTSWNLDKYILKFGQILCDILINTCEPHQSLCHRDYSVWQIPTYLLEF